MVKNYVLIFGKKNGFGYNLGRFSQTRLVTLAAPDLVRVKAAPSANGSGYRFSSSKLSICLPA
jgi:hypothetical protein